MCFFFIYLFLFFFFFFFNDTATTEIYTLSLHDALPILAKVAANGTVANKAFKYTDANTLAIDQVAQAGSTGAVLGVPSGADAQQALMNGISTRGGAVVVDTRSTGKLTVNQAIATTPTTAGANGGVVVLESGGGVSLAGSGAINN